MYKAHSVITYHNFFSELLDQFNYNRVAENGSRVGTKLHNYAKRNYFCS